jgi:hypothetical protein
MTETGTCSLCGGPYTHWGNNPSPLKDIEERCCDRCNYEKVIPARMGLIPGGLGSWEQAKTQNELARKMFGKTPDR